MAAFRSVDEQEAGMASRARLARRRASIARRSAVVCAILVGGLLWAYSMLHATGNMALEEQLGVGDILARMGQQI
jgi:hypothetical protein